MGFVTKVWNSPDNNPKGIQPTVVLRYKSEKKNVHGISLLSKNRPSKNLIQPTALKKISDSSNGAEPLYWVVVKYVPKTIFT